MIRHQAWAAITRQARSHKNEFRIYLWKLVNGQGGSIQWVTLHFSYATSLGAFLLVLRDMTALYKAGFTLEDGPWQYKLVKGSKAIAKWCYLTDENSFKEMLDKLKHGDGTAVMVHVSFLHSIIVHLHISW